MESTQSPQLVVENNCLRIVGPWLIDHYRQLAALNTENLSFDQLDFSDLEALDTAGASILIDLIGADTLSGLLAQRSTGLADARKRLITAILSARSPEPVAALAPTDWLDAIARLGQLAIAGWRNFLMLAGFIGLTLTTLVRVMVRPERWRFTAFVTQVHQTGLNALPIVALLTFLVGAVIAFLGATVLSNFGASIYTVNLVAYSFLREFGVVLTAILLAGRTASAFTAQIGAMKVNEEVDALRVLGLSSIELLVVPRVLALLVTLPLLTFVAMMSGLLGGAMVSLFSLDISVARYMGIVQEIPVRHFWVGLSKAPVFAFLIAVIGCLEGFKVEGSARSVGERTTSSVVQSIFVVILLDAVAAMFFMEMDW